MIGRSGPERPGRRGGDVKELDDFAAWMRTVKRSEHTIRSYRSDLAAFFAFVGHQRPPASPRSTSRRS